MVDEMGGAPQAGPKKKREFRRYVTRRKICAFCADKVAHIDYKDVARLRRYLSDRARIEPRRKTGTCSKHQRELSVALKRARHLALLPLTAEHMRWLMASLGPVRHAPAHAPAAAAAAPEIVAPAPSPEEAAAEPPDPAE